MAMRPRVGVTAGVLMPAAAFAVGCSADASYQPWWDQDKGAIVTHGEGTSNGADSGAGLSDAGGHADGGTHGGGDAEAGPPPGPLHTVFFILMARQPWSAIQGSPSAPYINGTLLPMGAHAEDYYAAPAQDMNAVANVVWLEAGGDLGFTKNNPPTVIHSATKSHLVDQLEAAGVTWKAYVEHATAGACPIADQYPPYRPWHVPFLYFDDVVGNPPSVGAKRCVQHVVPFAQLAADIASQAVPRYAFLVPDFCDDMHDDCNTGDRIRQGDDWLGANVPALLASKAYSSGGAVFVTWDFTDVGYDPIGFIALSPKAHAGLSSQKKHTASSTLRTLQIVFGVSPFLGDAANADDLGELFQSFP